MHRRITGTAVVAVAVLAPAAAAQAGTVALDKPCYVESTAMVATGTGFTPGSSLTLSGDGAFATATADAAGAFQVPIEVPINPSIEAKPSSIVTYTLDVEDYNDPTQDTSATYQVTNHGFETSKGTKSPRAQRTWWFAGLPTGSTVYGHFRYKGRTQAHYRFGTASGPCGLLTRKAPAIPAERLRSGTWTVQVDASKTYNSRTPGALRGSTVIFLTTRAR